MKMLTYTLMILIIQPHVYQFISFTFLNIFLHIPFYYGWFLRISSLKSIFTFIHQLHLVFSLQLEFFLQQNFPFLLILPIKLSAVFKLTYFQIHAPLWCLMVPKWFEKIQLEPIAYYITMLLLFKSFVVLSHIF